MLSNFDENGLLFFPRCETLFRDSRNKQTKEEKKIEKVPLFELVSNAKKWQFSLSLPLHSCNFYSLFALTFNMHARLIY
jgi:hypothetical protein